MGSVVGSRRRVLVRGSRVRRGKGTAGMDIAVDVWADEVVMQDRGMRMARRGSRNSIRGQGGVIIGVVDAAEGEIVDDLRRE